MAVLDCRHPDIEVFVRAKLDPGQLTNFNTSVRVDDIFMQSAEIPGSPMHKLFELIVECAHKTGDPGLLFGDEANHHNPLPALGPLKSTNPCGETWLLPNEACVLGSLNLAGLRVSREEYGVSSVRPTNVVLSDRLEELVHLAVRFLDDVIDVSEYASEDIRAATLRTRKIGLGVMGWADVLIKNSLAYDSVEARRAAESLMCGINNVAHAASRQLAKERGVPEALKASHEYNSRHDMRNAQCTVVAPTGTISMIAGCSSGIEPYYSLVTEHRNQLGGEPFTTVSIERPEGVSNEVWDQVMRNGKWPQDHSLWPVYKTAHEIHWSDHIAMQAAFQKNTDNAVSKTINMPEDATLDDVRQSFMAACRAKCKGVTVYRDKSKVSQVLNLPSSETEPTEPKKVEELERDPILLGFTHKVETGLGSLYVTVNEDAGEPIEVFANIGRAGTEIAAFTESLARMISLALRSGISLEMVTDQLLGIGGSNVVGFGGNRVLSVPDAIGKVLLSAHTILGPLDEIPSETRPQRLDLCPKCGEGMLVYQEGCCRCDTCDYSTC